jgi:hypothetical protein
LLTTSNETLQVSHFADPGTRMDALKEKQLGSIEGAETRQIPLIKQCFPNRAVRFSGDPPDGLLRIPIGSEQVRPEMPNNSVLRRCGKKLDHRKPVSDHIMIICR